MVGENLIKRNNGNIVYYYRKTKGFRRVELYVNEKRRSSLTELKGINERLAVLKMKINKSIPITCIQVYAPTNNAEELIVDQFYNQTNTLIEKERGTLHSY